MAAQIAQDTGLKKRQVQNTIELLDGGNTVPFIARYRKELTGELDEVQIRDVAARLKQLRNLQERKADVIRLIEAQGKLTDELQAAITAATTLQAVEDLYRPYRQKRRTRATVARERGLEPLAEILWRQEPLARPLIQLAADFLNPDQEVNSPEDALQGASDIIAEGISDDPALRELVRRFTWRHGILHTREIPPSKDAPQDSGQREKYRMYFDYQEPVRTLVSHRILAINRGEREGVLRVSLQVPDQILEKLTAQVVTSSDPEIAEFLQQACIDGYQRLLAPSIEREIRNQLTESAEAQAISVFSLNLRNLLLQPPVTDTVVLGIDPAFRTGCKLAVVDGTGNLLETGTIYPHEPQHQVEAALAVLSRLVEKYQVQLIAIGNGTASRETEGLVARLIQSGHSGLSYTIVNEAGASVYSASDIAREEFPDLDVSLRGAVSIARRIQDPLAELVKIDPRSIGVGQYQHDVHQGQLAESLKDVVESAVNYVGVDLNTASAALLQYVAGISPTVAKNIVAYRTEQGGFTTREQLLSVPRLGPKTYEQCAGFLKVKSGPQPLDYTAVHPESYSLAAEILQGIGADVDGVNNPEGLKKIRVALGKLDPRTVAAQLGAGEPTVRDIIAALMKPGRDPREAMPKPVFRKDVLSFADLREGMVLTGTVSNVVDFGAFVDIGVERNGLIHISQLSDQYVHHPSEIVAVGDVVTVEVLELDHERERIALRKV
ncbi:MAG: RNA-binding transcriptional accessory protein [Firmicutes bacterium]|nr:RNA-binding transcriptional accessory protein [Bacillota bacterium]